MKKKYLFSALLGILLATPIFAQTNLGADYLNTGELKVAKEIFEKQVSQSPAEAYYYLGEVAYREGNMAEAKANYDKSLAANPDYTLSNVGQGKLLLKSSPKAAEDLFSAAIKKDKKDVLVLVAIASAYYDNGMKDKGDKMLADARKADKKSPFIYLLMGDLVAKTNIGEAAGNYAQAYTFDPNFAVAYIKTAQVYETVNPTLAEEMLQKAIQINPNYTLAYKYLANIYYRNGQYQPAIETYKKYFAHGAYDVDDLTRYAAALFFTKQYEESKKLINEGIGKAPNSFVLNRLLMYSYLQSEDYTNGLATAEKFFALPKGDSEYIVQDYMSYGELLSKNGQMDRALAQYEEAIKLDPTKASVYKEIAASFKEARQYPEAAKYYQEYIDKADPSLLEAMDYYNLGQSAYYSATALLPTAAENPDAKARATEYLMQADKAFTVVTERIPDSYLGYQWRGNANAALDPETTQGLAKPHFEKVIEVLESKNDSGNNSTLTDAYRYMGFYYYQQWTKTKDATDKDLVSSYSNKILAIDPTNATAQALLDAVK